MFLPALLAAIQRWLRYNASVDALSCLSDRELDDLGISRSDIRAVAWRNA